MYKCYPLQVGRVCSRTSPWPLTHAPHPSTSPSHTLLPHPLLLYDLTILGAPIAPPSASPPPSAPSQLTQLSNRTVICSGVLAGTPDGFDALGYGVPSVASECRFVSPGSAAPPPAPTLGATTVTALGPSFYHGPFPDSRRTSAVRVRVPLVTGQGLAEHAARKDAHGRPDSAQRAGLRSTRPAVRQSWMHTRSCCWT